MALRNAAAFDIPDGEYLLASVPEKEYATRMFSLLIQDGDGAMQRHDLAPGGTTIGRNPENKIVLADGSVSSRHAEIIVGDGKALLRDLNSSNGTTVNGAAVTEIALTDGDEIVFGSVVCRAEAPSISTVPPTLPVIAPPPPRDEVVSPPPVQINTAQEPSSFEPKEEPAPNVSFWSKLLAFGKAASQETKRGVQIAGTKAKIEKLKRMDLSNAHYELGKKCFELRLHEDKFPTERAAIAELEKRIKEKQEGDSADGNETTGGKLKRMAGNAKQSVEAKGLSMKMNQLLTALGKQIAESGIAPAEVSTELTGVAKVNEAIRHAEEELSKLSADKSQQAEMKSLTGSISSDAGEGAKSGWRGIVSWIKAHPKPALVIVVVCASFVTYAVMRNASPSTSGAESQQSGGWSPALVNSDDILLRAQHWANQAGTLPLSENEAHLRTVQEQLRRLNLAFGAHYSIRVLRRLDPARFGFPKNYEGQLYEVVANSSTSWHRSADPAISPYKETSGPRELEAVDLAFQELLRPQKYLTSAQALLIANSKTFNEVTDLEILAKEEKEINVKTDDGFHRITPVLREVAEDTTIRKRLLELLKPAATISKAILDEKIRQQHKFR